MTTDHTSAALSSPAQEVLFIDSRVPDLQAIMAAARPGVKVFILDPNESVVAQMAQALDGLHGLASISVVSHGDEGVLLLGNGPLFSGNLEQYQAQLKAIGAALGADGDLQFRIHAGKGRPHWRQHRIRSTRRFLTSAASLGPNRLHQNHTVSWLISMPRSWSRSSTLRSDSGNLTYIRTTSRITSGEELKRRKGLGGRARDLRGISAA